MKRGTAWGMTMTERPPRPIQFCHPTEIHIDPKKWPNSKAFWSLTMKNNGEHLFLSGRCETMVEVIKRINEQFARNRYTDEQLWNAMRWGAQAVVGQRHHYHLASDGKVIVANNDKHEWHSLDEVIWCEWYVKQREEK